MSKIRITLAGATGWAGSALAKGIAKQEDLALTAAVSRKRAGADLGTVLGDSNLSCPVFASAQEALTIPSDVFFEYTKPDTAKHNILAALSEGRHVVVGTSGLTTESYAEIDEKAKALGRGVLAVGWLLDPITSADGRRLLELFQSRETRFSCMFLTQLPVSAWHSRFEDSTTADAILDRLVHNSIRVELVGESMRKLRAPDTSLYQGQNVASLRQP